MIFVMLDNVHFKSQSKQTIQLNKFNIFLLYAFVLSMHNTFDAENEEPQQT